MKWGRGGGDTPQTVIFCGQWANNWTQMVLYHPANTRTMVISSGSHEQEETIQVIIKCTQ
jgi:hypothetical protein